MVYKFSDLATAKTRAMYVTLWHETERVGKLGLKDIYFSNGQCTQSTMGKPLLHIGKYP